MTLLTICFTVITLYCGCGVGMNLPAYEYPSAGSVGKSIAVQKMTDARDMKDTKNIDSDMDAITKMTIDVLSNSGAFNSVQYSTYPGGTEKTDLLLVPTLKKYRYSEGPTFFSFFVHWPGLFLLGSGALLTVDDPSAHLLGYLFGGVSVIGSLFEAFGFKKHWSHSWEIQINYDLENVKTKEVILSDSVAFDYSRTFSHEDEYPIGEYHSRPGIKTIVYENKSADVRAIRSYCNDYIVYQASQRMLERVIDNFGQKLNKEK